MANDSPSPQQSRGWFQRLSSGQGIFARAMRGSIVVAGAYAFSQALRLASNLILARLLFPEAFGLMALVTVVIVGLQLVSDTGVSVAIAQHRRGDERTFLDTAYSINVLRGAVLWLGACAVAFPMARFYDAPQLSQLIPVAGVALFIAGFTPTKADTAARHLLLVRVTLLDVLANLIGVIVMVVVALLTRSIWSLVLASIVGNAAKAVLVATLLPGPRNRFAWDREAVHDLVHFGKWILLSTLSYFLVSQGDKMILGAYLSLGDLGTYNIGYFLGSFPMLMAAAVTSRILVPLYRDRPAEGPAAEHYGRKIRRMRYALSGSVIAVQALMSFFGVPLVDLLYGDRYAGAGPVVVMVACVQMISAFGATYGLAAIAGGDSRGHFFLVAVTACLQMTGLWLGFEAAGLRGAFAGLGVALLAVHVACALLARKHKAWDPVHDVVFLGIAMTLGALALGWNRGALGVV